LVVVEKTGIGLAIRDDAEVSTARWKDEGRGRDLGQ